MKKIILSLILIGIFPCAIFAQVVRWIYTHDTDNWTDEAKDVIVNIDGNIYGAGYGYRYGEEDNLIVVSLTPYGEERWIYEYNGNINGYDEAYSLTYSPDGKIYVAGTTEGNTADIIVIALDSNGNPVWDFPYIYDGGGHDVAFDITYGADGNLYLTGTTEIPGNSTDIIVISLTTDGVQRWVYTRHGSADGNDSAYCVVYGNDGNIYVAGCLEEIYWINKEQAIAPYFTIISLTNTGSERWVYQFYFPESYRKGKAHTVIYGNDGYIYGVGYSYKIYQSYNFIITKLNNAGNEIWVYSYNDPLNKGDFGYDIVYGEDGNIYAAGETEQDNTPWGEFTVLSVTPSGSERWVYTYNGLGNSWDKAHSIAYGKDGNVYAAGFLNGYHDFIAVSLKNSGEQNWVYLPFEGFANRVIWEKNCVYIAGFKSQNMGDFLIVSLREPLTGENDSLLAYNGNRHLARKPNSGELHLVVLDYISSSGNVIGYYYSSDMGNTWTPLEIIGKGKLPGITVGLSGFPYVAWTNFDTLYYATKYPDGIWHKNFYLFPDFIPSHPSISLTMMKKEEDSVHILFRLHNQNENYIKEISFHRNNPQNYQIFDIEYSTSPNLINLDFPSISSDYTNTLHAVWQHGDTIYYGTRKRGENWNVWGYPFGQYPEGLNSFHPFVETYGDSIFIVWENEGDGEIYRARRHVAEFAFYEPVNLSNTSSISIYPVNASGLYTSWADNLPNNFDIYLRSYPWTHLYNISNTPLKSIFCHSVMRPTPAGNEVYVLWQEGNESPYKIQSQRMWFPESPGFFSSKIAYFTTIPAKLEIKPHLTHRDTFSNLQIGVDIGYEYVAYEFEIDTGYTYYFGGILYSDKDVKEKIIVNGEAMKVINLRANKPEFVIFKIPKNLYSNEKIEIKFKKINGDYAIAGPIGIFKFEKDDDLESGIQSFKENAFFKLAIPSIFKEKMNLEINLPFEDSFKISIFDETGREIFEKKFSEKIFIRNLKIPAGTYILKIENEKGVKVYKKFIKIE
jgi:uncharacterized delta-60 repeat protein